MAIRGPGGKKIEPAEMNSDTMGRLPPNAFADATAADVSAMPPPAMGGMSRGHMEPMPPKAMAGMRQNK